MITRLPALLALAATSAACAQCPLEPFEPSALEGAAFWLNLFPTSDPVPGVYASGRFRLNGVETGLIRRSAGAWAPVAGAPRAIGPITQHIDARGPALFGVALPEAGAATTDLPLYRYDGASWEQSPGPVPGSDWLTWAPTSLASFDADGSGPLPPSLFLLVSFTYFQSQYVDTGALYEWQGGSWVLRAIPGAGMLAVLDADGAGPGLPGVYMTSVTTFRENVGTQSTGELRRWNGSTTENIASMSVPESLAVYDPDGSGPLTPRLAIGGAFTEIVQGSTPTAAPHVVLFDGQNFEVPGAGLDGDVQALAHFDPDGAGPMPPLLVAGGRFGAGLAAFDGAGWSAFGGGASGDTRLLRAFDEDASGPQNPSLLWSGRATVAQRAATGVAVYRGAWEGLMRGPGGPVNALDVFQQSLFAGGQFVRCGDTVVNNIARWNGAAWTPLGDGLRSSPTSAPPHVYCMTVHDDGSGPKLYVGGRFETAGGVAVRNLARWTGQAWEAVGFQGIDPPGPGGDVYALASFNGRLYAGGDFLTVSGGFAPNLAYWTASGWSSIPGSEAVLGAVRALKAFDDGTGPALYVGGDQTTPGGSVRLVWKLTADSEWVPLGGTTALVGDYPLRVNALEVHDAGLGPRLYAAGTIFPSRVRVLQGSSWVIPVDLSLPGFLPELHALRSIQHPGGNGLLIDDVLYANPHQRQLVPPPDGPILAISPSFDDGRSGAVFIAGDFQNLLEATHTPPGSPIPPVLQVPTPFIARYRPCPLCYANCDGSGDAPILNVLDFNCFLGRFTSGQPYANCDGSTAAPVLNVLDFNCFLNAFTNGCP
jgi:hypothetical protein